MGGREARREGKRKAEGGGKGGRVSRIPWFIRVLYLVFKSKISEAVSEEDLNRIHQFPGVSC